MPDQLTEALERLKQELSAFGDVQEALKTAHDKLTRAEQEWENLTKEQQATAKELVAATKEAIAATKAVTDNSGKLTDALVPLAEAINEVNFPLRLDKIDLAVATQASHSAKLLNEIGSVDENVAEGFSKVDANALATKKLILEAIAKQRRTTQITFTFTLLLLLVMTVVLAAIILKLYPQLMTFIFHAPAKM